MRISSKGRYALAAMVCMAPNHSSNTCMTVLSISQNLGISKIYLEQVFSLLKKGKLVTSIKGAQGGYQLSRSPEEINVYDVLSSVEATLFEKTEETVSEKAPAIEMAIRNHAFYVLDEGVKDILQKITLKDLWDDAEKYKSKDRGYMFYI